jgi:hypothetical protein
MKLQRRKFLRGMFQGSVAVMGVPFLDCFLDNSGQALAATGQRIHTRFSTFFFGLGLTTSLWVPKKAGLDYDTTVQLKPLEPFKKKMNVFSGMRVMVDDIGPVTPPSPPVLRRPRCRNSIPRPLTRPSPM